jgi:hypothetical protein
MSAGLGGTADSLQSDAVVKSIAEETGESEFWAVEQLAWGDSAVADVYERSFNSLTRQCIPALLDGVGCGEGTRLLDVATGPGPVLLAALVRARSGAALSRSHSSQPQPPAPPTTSCASLTHGASRVRVRAGSRGDVCRR